MIGRECRVKGYMGSSSSESSSCGGEDMISGRTGSVY